ncbi:MFS transporter [Streptomyces sp. TLI_146]|uniref:MFS transporter n=1 Tax=Streptomyces sp. TLI_146 TaxID=1938858 RepID=UPI000C714F9D|nr:MFS transporter [Streptomyces sp. TLI_146]PKV84119.1 putative MFS family arabinose efflux permease [Streptomyces sp. TLI_146]
MSSFHIFRANPAFRRYWSARSVSLVGDGIATVALLLLITGSGASPTGVAALLLAQAVPRFFGPIAGALPDRFEVRRLLLLAEIGQGVVFIAIALVPSHTIVLVPLVALASSLATVFNAAGRTVMPRVVDTDQLMPANAWMGTAFNLQAALGPVLGGTAAALIEPSGALLVNAVSFFIGAALLLGLPRMEPVGSSDTNTPGTKAPGFLAGVGAGIAFTWRHRTARAIFLLLLFGIMFASLDNVVLVFLARDVLDSGSFGFGLLGTGSGAAMVLASLWLTRSTSKLSAVTLLAGGWIVAGLGIALTGVAPVLAVAVATQALMGVGNSVAMIGEETLLQKGVPAEMLGRVGGALSSAAFAGSALAYAVGGFVASALAPRTSLTIAGVGLMAVTVLCLPGLRHRDAVQGEEPAEGDDLERDAAPSSPV